MGIAFTPYMQVALSDYIHSYNNGFGLWIRNPISFNIHKMSRI